MNQNYTTDSLSLEALKGTGKLIIPNFQRGVVWTKQHRKDFIETVKSGDPFGVILVWQEDKDKPYYLIDGLQRLSTLKAYMDKPLDYIDADDKFIDYEKLNKIIEEKYKAQNLSIPNISKVEKQSKTFLKNLIKEMKSHEGTPKATEIWSKCCEFLKIENNYFEVYKAFDEFYENFLNSLKLPSDILIYAIVYQGEKDRLPYVFETLNTTSVSLTKYEVFSSQWPTKKHIIKDDELIENVWKKYSDLQKSSSFEVDVTLDNLKEEGITLFEYCFGLSEIIGDEQRDYSFLFSKNKKSTDPTGFELLALACGLPVNKADDLYKDDYLGKADGKLLVDLKSAIIDSIGIVSNTLKKWVFDFNDNLLKNASSYQIYYIIMSVFKHKYNFNPGKKSLDVNTDKNNKDWIKNFKKNAHKWYLYQIINGYWNQHRQVSDLRNLLNNNGNYGGEIIDYASGVSKKNWEEALKKYCENREGVITRTIPVESKLFLNYLYKLLIIEDNNRLQYFTRTTEEGNEVAFDIEHIVPVNKFDKLNIDLPISALGNLCYLPVKDNRSKGDNTLYEYSGQRKSLITNKKFLKLINYPNEEELNSFLQCNADQFEKPFMDFVDNREKDLINEFVKLIIKH